MKTAQQIQTAIRLPPTLLDRIDKLAEQMSKRGIRVTRAGIIRESIFVGVEKLESDRKKNR